MNFKGQLSGAEGIKITNASNITLQDLTVQDTKGDGIKAQLVEGITFKNVKAEWTNGGSTLMVVTGFIRSVHQCLIDNCARSRC
jgi:hypothetical protein